MAGDAVVILVDEPRWPAHGTLYGHLVSDTSLWELHAFARRIGHDPRAFDHDHYDLPQRLHQRAVQAGAVLVGERELVRRLRAGGVRIRPDEHAPRRSRSRERIHAVASGLFAGWGAGEQTVGGYVDELVSSYTAEGRRYHDLRHLDEMLSAQQVLATADGLPGVPVAEQLATLFHDVVYHGVAGDDERASAAVAVDRLGRLGAPDDLAAEVERLVLLTIAHSPAPGDGPGARLSDADLAILAGAPGRYHVSVRDIRLEYARFDDQQWRAGRRSVLEHFLASDHLFATPFGRREWEPRARANIADELAHLDDD